MASEQQLRVYKESFDDQLRQYEHIESKAKDTYTNKYGGRGRNGEHLDPKAPKVPFSDWFESNYPMLSSSKKGVMQASQRYFQILNEVKGPEAKVAIDEWKDGWKKREAGYAELK